MVAEWMEIYHPITQGRTTVPRSAVPIHARSGWQQVQPECEVALVADIDSVPDSYNPDPIPDDDEDQSQGENQ